MVPDVNKYSRNVAHSVKAYVMVVCLMGMRAVAVLCFHQCVMTLMLR